MVSILFLIKRELIFLWLLFKEINKIFTSYIIDLYLFQVVWNYFIVNYIGALFINTIIIREESVLNY